ncbi:hypothetical protein OAO87_03390 [bacterium]|nr:hypothetical protein [bacterium]
MALPIERNLTQNGCDTSATRLKRAATQAWRAVGHSAFYLRAARREDPFVWCGLLRLTVTRPEVQRWGAVPPAGARWLTVFQSTFPSTF